MVIAEMSRARRGEILYIIQLWVVRQHVEHKEGAYMGSADRTCQQASSQCRVNDKEDGSYSSRGVQPRVTGSWGVLNAFMTCANDGNMQTQRR